jgi:hypothetical protein
MHRRGHWLLAALVVAAAALAGCGVAGSNAQAGTREAPVRVVPIQGTDLNTVILTADAARRLGIATEPVQALPPTAASPDPAAAGMTSMPTSALVYDKNGATWAYATTAPLTYVRQAVTVARIDGGVVVMQSGPPAGTPVVTVGAAELLGAEYGVAGE